MTVFSPALIILSLIIAVAVWLDSDGPVIHRARRIGLGGRQFVMYKFRSMRRIEGPSLTSAGDERITPFGQFLRTTRLDELPQIWNVLRGDMSLVGPRPEIAEFTERYRDEYREILTARPGLTGPTQVTFAVEEARLLAAHADPNRFYADHLLPRKVESDLEYVRSRSAARDATLLVRTVWLPIRLAAKRLLGLDPNERMYGPALRVAFGAGLVLLIVAFVATAGSPR